jgi:hypothetical protein
MLDQIEHTIAYKLAQHHHYPYAKEIYVNIFRHFSHFPLKLKHAGIKGDGQTITLLALVVYMCFDQERGELMDYYRNICHRLEQGLSEKCKQNVAVEAFLGCALYCYHPVELKNILGRPDIDSIFDAKEKYEYELKKNTILTHSF